VDRAFNPKFAGLSKIKIKVSDYLGSNITSEINSRFCQLLKTKFEVEDTTKFENINDMEVSHFIGLFCKSSWDDKKNKLWKNLGLPVMDKDFDKSLNKFFNFNEDNDVHKIFEKLKKVEGDFPYLIVDLIFRKTIKQYFDLF